MTLRLESRVGAVFQQTWQVGLAGRSRIERALHRARLAPRHDQRQVLGANDVPREVKHLPGGQVGGREGDPLLCAADGPCC